MVKLYSDRKKNNNSQTKIHFIRIRLNSGERLHKGQTKVRKRTTIMVRLKKLVKFSISMFYD